MKELEKFLKTHTNHQVVIWYRNNEYKVAISDISRSGITRTDVRCGAAILEALKKYEEN